MRIDLAVAAAVAVIMALTITGAEEPGSQPPDALAYLLGVATAAWVLARRRYPVGAIAGTIATLMVYLSLGYPAFSPALSLVATAYYAALAGRAVPAALLVGGFTLFGTAWQTLGDGTPLFNVLGATTLGDCALLAAVILLGETVRSRRSSAEAMRARARLQADQRAEEERLRIARELHDVMAHTIVGLSVQASVAADVIDDAPDEAKRALAAIREQSGEAMAELRAVVGVLRAGGAGDAPRAPAPGLGHLDGLVEVTEGAGVTVDVAVDGPARPLSKAIDLTAYRIIQESLTNVIRHAHARAASVRLRYDPGALVLEVADDGVGAGANGACGHGIAGMRERAAAVGGTLAAGPVPEGGFRVRATLPAP